MKLTIEKLKSLIKEVREQKKKDSMIITEEKTSKEKDD